jgi:DNA-binding transcriptional LysR family regulator
MRIFLSVAREHSLSAAGRVLKLDPATVGRRVSRLEEATGAALFLKSPQGYDLTEAGERLLTHAETAEQAMLGAEAAVTGDDAERLSGTIRIGAPDGCANYLLPQTCRAIAEAHPALDLQILALPRVMDFGRREADLAVTVSRPSAGRLTVQKIADYRLCLAAHRRYLERAGPIDSVEALRHHRIVGYIPDMIFDSELDYLSELGLSRVALSSNSASVQLRLLAEGAGVGMMHDFALPFAPRVTRVLPDRVSLTRTFYLVRHASDRRVERLNRFAGMLVAGLRSEIDRLQRSAA